MTNKSQSGLMYEAGGAKSIWEPSVVSSIKPQADMVKKDSKSEKQKDPI